MEAGAGSKAANTVNVYDSLYKGISQETKSLIGEYHQGDKVKINIMNVQQQENGSAAFQNSLQYLPKGNHKFWKEQLIIS